MRVAARLLASLCLAGVHATAAGAEVFIRWDLDDVPASRSLGIATLVVPAARADTVSRAMAGGYRVYLEIDASALPGFAPAARPLAGLIIRGTPSDGQLRALTRRLETTRVLVADERGRWPHIRSNVVTLKDQVLQVSGRSAQPWIESNAALVRLRRAESDRPLLLTYSWRPVALADADQGPELEDYLLAIAEAGSFGGDLLLPLHERFQRDLVVGDPQARARWDEIRRYLDFYASDLPARYRPLANIGLIATDAAAWFEIMNLMARHNLPFELVSPARLDTEDLSAFDLLIVLDRLTAARLASLTAYATRGRTVVFAVPDAEARGTLPWRGAPARESDGRATYAVGTGQVIELVSGPGDPDRFALEVRRLLDRDTRLLDIWNGITVLAAPFRAPASPSVLLTLVNYAHRPLPVQLRVRGVFSAVRYETPGHAAAVLPHQHRNGHTEFVLPALHVGGRVFLTGAAAEP